MKSPDFSSIEAKIDCLKKSFPANESPEKRYGRLIEWGRSSSPLPPEDQIETNRVPGCQSRLFLISHLEEDRLVFRAYSDALISSGLAALLLHVYSEEKPLHILLYPPQFLHTLNILPTLSPSRSNGVISLYKKMQLHANQALIN